MVQRHAFARPVKVRPEAHAGTLPASRLGGRIDDSRINLAHDMAFDIGQPEIAACVAIRQTFVVEAQQVQDRGVQVVNVDLVLRSVVAVVVGRAVAEAAFHAAAGQPHREAFLIVVAPGAGA